MYDEDEGFLRVTSKPVEEITLEDVKHDFETAAQLVSFTRTAVLADSRDHTNYTNEIRDFYASKEMAENISAMAILITSLSTRIIGNFFIKIHKPHFPTRLFTNEEDAARWLKKFSRETTAKSSSSSLSE